MHRPVAYHLYFPDEEKERHRGYRPALGHRATRGIPEPEHGCERLGPSGPVTSSQASCGQLCHKHAQRTQKALCRHQTPPLALSLTQRLSLNPTAAFLSHAASRKRRDETSQPSQQSAVRMQAGEDQRNTAPRVPTRLPGPSLAPGQRLSPQLIVAPDDKSAQRPHAGHSQDCFEPTSPVKELSPPGIRTEDDGRVQILGQPL